MPDRMISGVRLLALPLERDQKHTLWFKDYAQQYTYFATHALTEFDNYDFSFLRKENAIAFPANYDELRAKGVNYLMYSNRKYDGKWFFAFITNMEYKNENMTMLHIETDVLQTYMFDYELLPSFVIREHVDDDTIGLHTLAEDLELGEYVVNKQTRANYTGRYGNDLSIVVATTIRSDTLKPCNGGMYDGIYSGVKYYTFKHDQDEVTTTLEGWLDRFDEVGRGEAIQCMFLAPQKLAPSEEGVPSMLASTSNIDSYYINTNEGLGVEYESNFQMTDEKLQGYTPMNNKLLTYPYRYLLVSNNMGSACVYKYERFYENLSAVNGAPLMIHPRFTIEGCLTPGCSIRLIPENYNGVEWNHEEALNMGKFPILNWTSDVYTNWLVQNSSTMQQREDMAKITAGLGIASGIGAMMTGNVVVGGGEILGSALNAYNVATSILAEKEKASKIPAQSKGNMNCGDVITASGENDFFFYDMTIREEYAKIIDDYFTMYGYKCNRVKVPNENHMSQFWYTQLAECNIKIITAVPQDDLAKIKACYLSGVTFWRSADRIRDYKSWDNYITDVYKD